MAKHNGNLLTITFNGVELKGQVTSAELTWSQTNRELSKSIKRAILSVRHGLPFDAIELQEPRNNPELS